MQLRHHRAKNVTAPAQTDMMLQAMGCGQPELSIREDESPERAIPMARRVFYSFHYQPDCWRVSQVRNIGAIEENKPATDNDWEQVKRGGDAGIQRWIDDQLDGRSCTVVLIGSQTANRKWINYEIIKSWNDRKGLLGIHVHNLKDRNQSQCAKGENPFDYIPLGGGPRRLSSIVPVHDPMGWDSTQVYASIKANIEAWIDQAIEVRNKH
jgi:hypothetical protein